MNLRHILISSAVLTLVTPFALSAENMPAKTNMKTNATVSTAAPANAKVDATVKVADDLNGATKTNAVHTNLSDMLTDGTYVSLYGEVGKITDGDEFKLVTADGTIDVDTNDYWPALFNNEATEYLKKGDKVAVVGKVDKNYFTNKEIDAIKISYQTTDNSRDYVSKELGFTNNLADITSYETDNISLSGKVIQLNEDEEEFTLKYDAAAEDTIRVDYSDLDLEDNVLKVGDYVVAYGDVEKDWWETRELEAEKLAKVEPFVIISKR